MHWKFKIVGLWLIPILLLGCACSPSGKKRDDVKVFQMGTKDELLEVAESEVRRREGKNLKLEAKEIETSEKGKVYLIWILPKTPGGHRVVEVSPERKIIRYEKGR